ncbi:MAG TPA: molybdopterin oxidoreductase family protein [Candidatus Hypogeohydataceae bacterium YC38]
MKLSRRDFHKLAGSVALGVGAYFLDDKAVLSQVEEPDSWVYSTCGYCSVGCGMLIGVKDGKAVAVKGDEKYPVNKGKLCIKGIYEHKIIDTKDRLTMPLHRYKKEESLREDSWDEVMKHFVEKLNGYRPDQIAVLCTGQLVTEEFYLLGKLVRTGIKTPHYDANTTLCMASAVVGYAQSFGSDGPPGCYEDFEHAEVIMSIGWNPTEQHPIIYDRLQKAMDSNHPKIIVVDPRKTLLGRVADLYLPINPATDVTLLNAMIRIIIQEGYVDEDFIREHTTGFEALKAHVEGCTPEVASQRTGIPEEDIIKAARLFGQAKTAVTCWCMGVNQSVEGTKIVKNINNLHLITGKIGKPGCAPFSITGQCNAMGSREYEGKAKGLPGYRSLWLPDGRKHTAYRQEVAQFWGVDESIFPEEPGESIMGILRAAREGKIKMLWIIAHNVGLSGPNRKKVLEALKNVEFLVVQDVYHPTDTSEHADMVLAGAMWGEKTGTMTNSERRVNLAEAAVKPPGEAKTDFEIFMKIAELVTKEDFQKLFPNKTPRDVFDKEIRKIGKGRPCDYSGMDYDKIKASGGIQWPANEASPGGTKRLYTNGVFNTLDGRAKLHPVDDKPLPEAPDAEYPYVLNTGRVIEHWHTGTKTRKVLELNALVPRAYVEINPVDAEKLKISFGDEVEVESRRGKVSTWARVTSTIKQGTVFIPFFDSKVPVNDLTVDDVDEESKEPNFKQAAVKIRRKGII